MRDAISSTEVVTTLPREEFRNRFIVNQRRNEAWGLKMGPSYLPLTLEFPCYAAIKKYFPVSYRMSTQLRPTAPMQSPTGFSKILHRSVAASMFSSRGELSHHPPGRREIHMT